jgi:hypothetical protein
LLQNYGSSEPPIIYYVFDILVLSGRDVCGDSLEMRRDRTCPPIMACNESMNSGQSEYPNHDHMFLLIDTRHTHLARHGN